MDGNGRWAENRDLPRVEGHRVGTDAVKTVVECCLQKKIPLLSLFAFSSENWSRPEMEVDFLMQLFIQSLEREIQTLHEQGVRLRFTGERSLLSSALRTQMQSAETLTADNQRLILNVVVNYSGKWDIVQAAKALAVQVAKGELSLEEINEITFGQYLNTGDLPDPDLFIRTSGEQRISNFFLWQLAYTELYFSDVQWPDFNALEFEKALATFSSRERRFGKISKQINEKNHV